MKNIIDMFPMYTHGTSPCNLDMWHFHMEISDNLHIKNTCKFHTFGRIHSENEQTPYIPHVV